jgi:Na+(H+)/acetate symporter ActP
MWPALRDPRVLALFLVGFASGCSQYGTGLWLPQIVNAMGFSTLATGIVVALCNAFAIVAMLFAAHSTDRRGRRSLHGALAQLVAVCGYLVAVFAPGDVLMLLGLTFAVAGTLAAIGPFFTIIPGFLRGPAAAGAIALVNTGRSRGTPLININGNSIDGRNRRRPPRCLLAQHFSQENPKVIADLCGMWLNCICESTASRPAANSSWSARGKPLAG